MENSLSNEIQSLIDKVSMDKTFTVEAINTFSELQKKVSGLEYTNGELERQREEYRASAEDSAHSVIKLNKNLGLYEKREDELIKREIQITKLELQAHHESIRVSDHKEMVQLIFRNSVFKEKNIMTKLGEYDPGTYQTAPNETTDTEITKEQE